VEEQGKFVFADAIRATCRREYYDDQVKYHPEANKEQPLYYYDLFLPAVPWSKIENLKGEIDRILPNFIGTSTKDGYWIWEAKTNPQRNPKVVLDPKISANDNWAPKLEVAFQTDRSFW
jgi:hypothetical protein